MTRQNAWDRPPDFVPDTPSHALLVWAILVIIGILILLPPLLFLYGRWWAMWL